MPLTDQFYGSNTTGVGRVIQDFGLCDLKGEYLYTAKVRVKGLLVVVFFDPASDPSRRALETVQAWAKEMTSPKWSAVGVAEGERDELAALVEQRQIDAVTVVIDHELYQTRRWGVSHLPSVYLVQGKTGRVLSKIIGDDRAGLDAAKQMLADEIAKIVAAEEAAKKAEEEKKAAEEAAKAAQASAADKPSEPKPAAAKA